MQKQPLLLSSRACIIASTAAATTSAVAMAALHKETAAGIDAAVSAVTDMHSSMDRQQRLGLRLRHRHHGELRATFCERP